MTRAFLLVLAAYVMASAGAVGTGLVFHTQPPIVIVGLADLAATIVVFFFSVLTNNSSVYDPYWSVAPVPLALFWLLQPGSNGFANPRHVLIFVLLCLWAIRLTTNWAIRWHGLSHEIGAIRISINRQAPFTGLSAFLAFTLCPLSWSFWAAWHYGLPSVTAIPN